MDAKRTEAVCIEHEADVLDQVETPKPATDPSPEMLARMCADLGRVESFDERRVLSDYGLPPGGDGRRALWSVLQSVREAHGVEFVPVGGRYVRASVSQRIRRGRSFAKAARRKLARALNVLEAVPVDIVVDDSERRALESARNKVADMVLIAEARARHEKKPRPSGI